MRGKQCATCNASECRGKRAKRLRAHLGITEVRRPGYAALQSNYHNALPRSYASAGMPNASDPQAANVAAAYLVNASAGGSANAHQVQQQGAGGQQGQQAISASPAPATTNWGARAVFGDHKYPTIRTGAPTTRVQMDALMHKCTMAATAGRQWQRVSTRDPQIGTYACREDNNNNIRLELSGSVLSKLAGFVVVASVAAELGLDKIPDSGVTQGAVVLTAGHNVDVEPWGAPDHHKALLLITVAGDTVVAVAKTDGASSSSSHHHYSHHHHHPLPNLFRTNPAQSNCVFQLFYASRGDLVYVPPGASYQTRHIGNDHILLVVKVDPLSFTSVDSTNSGQRGAAMPGGGGGGLHHHASASATTPPHLLASSHLSSHPSPSAPPSASPQVVTSSPVSYLAYPLGGAANHLASASSSASAGGGGGGSGTASAEILANRRPVGMGVQQAQQQQQPAVNTHFAPAPSSDSI